MPEHKLSRTAWNHKLEEIDYVVSWGNGGSDFPKPGIVLRQEIRNTERGRQEIPEVEKT